jgi:hypothetical protein
LFLLSIIFQFTVPNAVFSAATIVFVIFLGLYVFIMPVLRAILRSFKLGREKRHDA